MRREALLAGLVGIVLGLPLFVHADSSGLSSAVLTSREDQEGVDLPVSVFIIPLILVWVALRGQLKITKTAPWRLVLAIIALHLLVFGIGAAVILTTASPALLLTSSLFLLQTLLPISAFILVPSIVGKSHTLAAILVLAFAGTMAITATVLVVQSLIEVGLSGILQRGLVAHIGPFAIPKVRRYYPTLIAVSGIVGMALWLQAQRGWLRGIGLGFLSVAGMALPLLWSRSAIVAVALGSLTAVAVAVSRKRSGGQGNAAAVKAAAWLLPIGGVLAGYALLNKPLAIRRLLTIPGAGELTAGDVNRFDAIVAGIRAGLLRPLGQMYIPTMNETLGGISYDFPRILITENAYLDYAVRAGPIAFALIVFLSLSTLRHAFRPFRADCPASRARWMNTALAGSYSAIVLWSNMTQLNFTEPYVAFVVWGFTGLIWAYGGRPLEKSQTEAIEVTRPGGVQVAIGSAGVD